MKNSTYSRILYFIGAVILITLCIQFYWNYKNYQQGKQQLLNEVQISLDNAIEKYYASGAQKSTRITLQQNSGVTATHFSKFQPGVVVTTDSTRILRTDSLKLIPGTRFEQIRVESAQQLEDLEKVQVFGSARTAQLDTLVGRILFSMVHDTINMRRMDSLLQSELHRKNIDVEYGLLFSRKDKNEQKLNPEVIEEAALSTASKSTWLPRNASLTLFFTNETATILKANIVGILLSALLMAAVIGCLLFLLKIINNQKQLDDLKNDLISNITHEFKTPIATIGVAMEGILNFNTDNDPERTKSYARTSNDQLEKLNAMVEKLLETATLSGNKLELKKEDVELIMLLKNLVSKWEELAPQKTFSFKSEIEQILVTADPFHMENAFNNILDNAVKYGGNEISVTASVQRGTIQLIFADNGNTLTPVQAEQIFDKFYRVPTGNTHDVKGFGIGLFYTREIIEKHGGSIRVDVSRKTQFLIALPHA